MGLQKLKNIYHLLEAIIANIVYGFPSRQLKVIAITGTDGKTTTTTLTYHLLKQAGFKVALISTVAAYIGEEEIDTGFHVTTPSPFSLQRLLRRIANQRYEVVVLEVTSHGIDQNRVWGIRPLIAAITNVTHEHLDYHKTFEQYVHTKARLLLRAETAILNQDAIASYELLRGSTESAGVPTVTVGVDSLSRKLRQAVYTRFGDEEYNYQNTAIACAIAAKFDIAEKKMIRALTNFPGIRGRMEEISRARGIRVIVDFAHTPNALEQALQALRPASEKSKKVRPGHLIVVFGCAGLRDHTKRPLMGEIATRLADRVILTAEDPRTEDVWSIIAQIKSGVQQGHGKIVSIPDRFRAIEYAIKTAARPGDIVVITGKGHEKSMCFGTVEHPWSDQDAVRKVIST